MKDGGTKKPQAEGPIEYPSELATPFSAPSAGLLKKTLVAEHEKRTISALFRFFAIDIRNPNRWETLAMELARRHVPGMKVIEQSRQKRGQRLRWRGRKGKELMEDLENLAARLKGNYSAAARQLVQTEKWKFLNDAKTMTARYRQARKEVPRYGPLDGPDTNTMSIRPKKRPPS
jgi:hypothetical protein